VGDLPAGAARSGVTVGAVTLTWRLTLIWRMALTDTSCSGLVTMRYRGTPGHGSQLPASAR